MLFLELNRSLHFTDIIIMGTETACTPAAQDQPDTGTAGAGHPSGSGAGVIVIGSSSRWRDLGDFGAVARTGDRAAVVVVCVAGSGDSAFCRGGLQKAKASHSSENDTWQWPTGAAPCPDVAPERVSHRGGPWAAAPVCFASGSSSPAETLPVSRLSRAEVSRSHRWTIMRSAALRCAVSPRTRDARPCATTEAGGRGERAPDARVGAGGACRLLPEGPEVGVLW